VFWTLTVCIIVWFWHIRLVKGEFSSQIFDCQCSFLILEVEVAKISLCLGTDEPIFEYHLWETEYKFYKYCFGFCIYHNDLCRNNSVSNQFEKVSQGYYHGLVEALNSDSSTKVFGWKFSAVCDTPNWILYGKWSRLSASHKGKYGVKLYFK